MLQKVRVYYSSLQVNRCHHSHNRMIHILEQSRVDFKLIDCAHSQVDADVRLLEKDDNIFFPQVFKYDGALRAWIFKGTLENIIDWNDSKTLQHHLQGEGGINSEAEIQESVASVPDLSHRKGKNGYLSLIQASAKPDEGCDDISKLANDGCILSHVRNDADLHEHPTEHDRVVANYRELTAKYSSLEHAHKQETGRLEYVIAKLTTTNQELSAQQKLLHEKNVFQDKLRLDSLRTKVSELEKKVVELERRVVELETTVEQQDNEIKTYDNLAEEAIVLHARTKHQDAHIAELVSRLQQMTQDNATQEQAHATDLIAQLKDQRDQDTDVVDAMCASHASEVASLSAQIMRLEIQVSDSHRLIRELQQSLVDKKNTESCMQMRMDEQDATIRLQAENGRQRASDTSPRADEQESKRQFIQLCRLQNEKERILITQLTANCFLP
jgi:hypothetical protein